MRVVWVSTSSKGPYPREEEEDAPPPKAPMAWPVCARTDDANQNGARWRPLPAPKEGVL